jgi:hypothetical protein
MKKFGFIAAIVAALIGAFIWYINQPDHYYRLGIEVETPDGLKSAANTFGIHQSYHTWGLPETNGLRVRFMADAVFLDLGNGHNVVALLAHGPHGQDTSRIEQLDNIAFSEGGAPIPWYATKDLTGSAPLLGKNVPTLATLSDINDPSTARVIKPDGFEAAFGPGYRFKRAWIEMAEGPVSRNIKSALPWVGNYKKETVFDRALLAGETRGPSLSPGRNLRRDL